MLGTPIASRTSMMAVATRTSSSVVPRLLLWRAEIIAEKATTVPPCRPRLSVPRTALPGRTSVSCVPKRQKRVPRLRCRTLQRSGISRAPRRSGGRLRAVDERRELHRRGERGPAAHLVGERQPLRAVVDDGAAADGQVHVVRPQRAVERGVAGLLRRAADARATAHDDQAREVEVALDGE